MKNKNKKGHVGFYLFICLFFCIGLGWGASDWNATFKNARDPEEAFKPWVPEMCILFYQFWKGRRAKWHLYLKYAQMFLQTTKLSTVKTKRALDCLLEKNTGKQDSIIFRILRTVPSPLPSSPPPAQFSKKPSRLAASPVTSSVINFRSQGNPDTCPVKRTPEEGCCLQGPPWQISAHRRTGNSELGDCFGFGL